MENQFIPYEQALRLKELGFDEECLGYWNNVEIPKPYLSIRKLSLSDTQGGYFKLAPLYQQAFRWFRDKKLSDSCICRYQSRDDGGVYYYYVINHDFGIKETRHFEEGFFSYKEAELACLKKLIEIV